MSALVETQLDFFAELEASVLSQPSQAATCPSTTDSGWSLTNLNEEQFDKFVEGYFKGCLAPLLDGRAGPQQKRELLEWVSLPLVHHLGEQVIPFSFEACCLLLGGNPEELQEQVLDQVRLAQRRAARS